MEAIYAATATMDIISLEVYVLFEIITFFLFALLRFFFSFFFAASSSSDKRYQIS